MLWFSWAFVCGLPVGIAICLALVAAPARGQLGLAAAAGGGAVTALAWALARRSSEPGRERHLALAASSGWYAAAAALAIFADWAPGPLAWAASVPVVLAIAFLRATRASSPAPGALRCLLRAVSSGALGAALAATLAAAFAALGVRPVEPSARFAGILYSIDAGVVTRPLPVCDATPRSTKVLRASGANPVLSPDDRFLFFDAPAAGDGGRRQIHRLERSTGRLRCWTCGDPGNNVRPSLNSAGISMIFESDRDATWRHPDETELYLAGIAKRVDTGDPGRRLSFLPGPDTHPIFGPGPQMITWSRREGGRYRIASATIRSGHGGILLGTIGVLAEGGAQWTAPVTWSADGRALVIVRGNPFAALEGAVLDPATGETRALGDRIGLGASLNGDGAWLAFATTRSHHTAGALPRALGFALAPLAQASRAPLREGTGVRSGSSAAPGEAVALALPDEIASWGEPAGLAFGSDASFLVLGQRRATGDGVEDRLVHVELGCTQLATAPRAIPAAVQ